MQLFFLPLRERPGKLLLVALMFISLVKWVLQQLFLCLISSTLRSFFRYITIYIWCHIIFTISLYFFFSFSSACLQLHDLRRLRFFLLLFSERKANKIFYIFSKFYMRHLLMLQRPTWDGAILSNGTQSRYLIMGLQCAAVRRSTLS